jgi:cysteinyl-tRNA synthetase
VPEEIEELLAQRQAARSAKDFGAADRLRDEITARGYKIVDTPQGPRAERV